MDATTTDPNRPPATGPHAARDAAALMTPTSRRTLAGLGLSLLVHVLLLGFLALILLEGPGGGAKTYGPAVEMSTGAAAAGARSSTDEWLDESLPDLAEAVPMPEITPDPSGASPSVVSAGSSAPAALAGGAGDAAESGLSLGGAAGAGASFFGVEASGSRIVYIVDVSGSMLHNGKIDALRRELLGSLSSLPPGSEFVVIVFSDEGSTRALGGARWRSADAAGRSEVETSVRGLSPSGGTEPLEAFRIAFDLAPKPEAIYFMTDGELPQREAAEIIGTVRHLNERSGPRAPIHCIAFGSRTGASDLRRIARQSGGSYTFVSAGGRP